jgi:hypothetical protein
MHRNLSNFVAVALIAAISLGLPAVAKSIQKGKANSVANDSIHSAKAERTRLLIGNGPVRRAPASGASNPNSPAVAGGGTSYNPDLYVY